MLCDLCIIQLNVSYQFKNLAVEVDGKHQQYLIENGLNLSPNSDNSNSTVHSVEQRTTLERSSATVRPLTFPVSLSNLHRRVIKSEPITDYEIMSDITIDTNTDLLEDFSRNGVNSSASNQPFGTSNMVCVSDMDLLRSNGDSDSEFINNCLPSSFRHFENPTSTLANTLEQHQSTTTTTTTTTIASKQLVIAASKSTTKSTTKASSEKHTHAASTNETVEQVKVVSEPPKRKRVSRFTDAVIKKSLRPKSNGGINYSVSGKRRKSINPVNKVRQSIKEESETAKQASSKGSPNVNNVRALVPRNTAMLRSRRRSEISNESSQFRRGHHAANKEQYRENLSVRRRVTIKETDRFKFASFKTIDSVTRN